MNEETTKQLNEFLSKLNDDGGDIILEQAPLFIQEIVAYGRGVHTVGFIAGLAIFVSSVLISRKLFLMAQAADKFYDQSGKAAACGVSSLLTGAVGGIIGIAFTCENFYEMSQAWLAPRLYVVEYLAKLVN